MVSYRGVPLDPGQSFVRQRRVCHDIDAAARIDDIVELCNFAGDVSRAPESRLFAAARAEAMRDARVEAKLRASIDVDKLHATVGGLRRGGCDWSHPHYFCSDLDFLRSDGLQPVAREPSDEEDRDR